MHFEPDYTYHIYNRSNETVFYSHDNYLYFLGKVNKLIKPISNILAWCLMPNHFHFLLTTKPEACDIIKEFHRPDLQLLSKNFGTLLSSYTRAINKERKRKGKLFAHNTQAKCMNDALQNDNLLENCFHYIHQNPLRAGLCKTLDGWEYSSFLDYAGKRNGLLINKDLAQEVLNYNQQGFIEQSQVLVDQHFVKELY